MRDEPVRVEAYAGGRGGERPLRFLLDEEWVEAVELLRSWIEEERDGRERRRFFEVRGSDGGTHLLYFDEKMKAWFIRFPKVRPRRI